MTFALPRLNRLPAEERGITIADFLVPIGIAESMSARVRHLVLVAAGLALVALCARVVVPIASVPLTGQAFGGEPIPLTGVTFGVLLAGGALGFRRGLVAMLAYVGLGAVGLTIYPGGGAGTGVLAGPAGGYLLGLIVAAAIVGRLAELGWDRSVPGAIGAMLLGTAAIHAVWLPWLVVVADLSPGAAATAGLAPLLVWHALQLALVAGVFPIAWWIVGRRPEER